MSQNISSLRIVNKDGSIPRSTDELILRGFEILREDREKRRREKEIQPRITSDGSSRSSATYVCSPTEHSGSANISKPQDNRPANAVSSSGPTTAESAPRNTQDIKRQTKASLEMQEANIRAMQAEIAALKRAAILTRELRNEAAFEKSTKSREGVELNIMAHKSTERRATDSEILISRGNGIGEEEETTTPRPVSNELVYHSSMEGLPTPPQLLSTTLRTKERTTDTRHSQRSQRKHEKRKLSREKLCLCPNCILITQQVVSTLVERYAMQKSTGTTSFHLPPQDGISLQKLPQTVLQIDPKSYHHPCHTTPTNSSKLTIQSSAGNRAMAPATSYSPHKTQKSISNSSSNNQENHILESPHAYMSKMKRMRDGLCDCYRCRFAANREEFDRKNAPFPPIRNGVWARGRDSRGYWYW